MTSEGSTTPDLRTRILRASEELLEQEGLGALSMREVARRAGVSHQAPYHHFADKASILAALVEDGFGMLAERLKAVADEEGVSAEERLRRAGEVYVGFAFERGGVFRVMFRPELVELQRFPAAKQAGEETFAQLVRLVGQVRPGADMADTVMVWSLAHGLSNLLLDGLLSVKMPEEQAREALRRWVLARFARLVAAG